MPPCGICQTCVSSMCSGPSERRPMKTSPARLSTMTPTQGRYGKSSKRLVMGGRTLERDLDQLGWREGSARFGAHRGRGDPREREAAVLRCFGPDGNTLDRYRQGGRKCDRDTVFARHAFETHQRAI